MRSQASSRVSTDFKASEPTTGDTMSEMVVVVVGSSCLSYQNMAKSTVVLELICNPLVINHSMSDIEELVQ